jgi:hypothetical protein
MSMSKLLGTCCQETPLWFGRRMGPVGCQNDQSASGIRYSKDLSLYIESWNRYPLGKSKILVMCNHCYTLPMPRHPRPLIMLPLIESNAVPLRQTNFISSSHTYPGPVSDHRSTAAAELAVGLWVVPLRQRSALQS